MAAPSSYTESTFKAYLHTVLGAVADVLGWTTGDGDYDEVVNETLLAYGTDDITSVSGRDNIRALRALGRAEAWRAVVVETATDFDFQADGGDYKRSQIHQQAVEALRRAEDEAAVYDDRYAVEVATFEPEIDPYAVLTYDDLVEDQYD